MDGSLATASRFATPGSRRVLAALVYWGTICTSIIVTADVAWKVVKDDRNLAVLVRPASLDSPIQPDRPIAGRIRIVNRTKGKLWIQRGGVSHVWVDWRGTPDQIPADVRGGFGPCEFETDAPEIAISPGEMSWCFHQIQPLPNASELDRLKQMRPQPLWLTVFITYRGENGSMRRAQFCHIYDPIGHQFLERAQPSCTWSD